MKIFITGSSGFIGFIYQKNLQIIILKQTIRLELKIF